MNPHRRSFILKTVLSLTLVACVAVVLIRFQDIGTGLTPVSGCDATAMFVDSEGANSAVDAAKTAPSAEPATLSDRSGLRPHIGSPGLFSSGRDEFNLALDWILGIRSPVSGSASPDRGSTVTLAKANKPEGKSAQAAAAEAKSVEQPDKAAGPPKGKRRPPGAPSPTAPVEKGEIPVRPFVVERDPFRPPTEVLPTECPPSLPLCRYDRAQLKLVGVIQVDQGHFKGMVEDPDGRGYFITPGMQIGSGTASATVMQINDKGITLHVHRSRQDVVMPLFKEPKEGE